jgi:transposase
MKDTITIGMDLGDKFNIAVVFNGEGKEVAVAKVSNTKVGISKYFKKYQGSTVAIEAGTHSPWISRCLEDLGCHVYVGNPRKLRFIWDSMDKSDERDARMLGMVCRIEPRLLSPLRHRGQKAQSDLALVKSRDILVTTRTRLINHVRSVVKTNGERLPSCSTDYFVQRCAAHVPEDLQASLACILESITQVSDKIHELDAEIDRMCREEYPETQLLQQVPGVGPITALAFVLTLEDPAHFKKSRQVGAFLGLTPRRDQSGDTDKQLRITKAGNIYMRKLLITSSHYIIGRFGPDSHLRRHGLSIAERGGKNAKKRAVCAVARKLGVLLHRLWSSEQPYEPFYGIKHKMAA